MTVTPCQLRGVLILLFLFFQVRPLSSLIPSHQPNLVRSPPPSIPFSPPASLCFLLLSFTPFPFLHFLSSLTSSQPCSEHPAGSAGTASFLPPPFWPHSDWLLWPFDGGGERAGAIGGRRGKGGHRRQQVLDWLCRFRSGPPGEPVRDVRLVSIRSEGTLHHNHVAAC